MTRPTFVDDATLDLRQSGPESSGPVPDPKALSEKMWLSDLSIRQPIFITMLVAAVLIVGGLSYSRLAMDLFPNMTLPVVAVTTVYPGVDPREIERSVSKPIEDSVASIGGVRSVRSTSMDSVSLVIVEFAMETDGKAVADEVRNRVDLIRNSLPDDVEEPVIDRYDPAAAPVMIVAIANSSGNRSQEQLRTLVDDVVKRRFERVEGVASVEVTGGAVREVHVDLKLDRLQAYGVAPQQVIQAIRSENLNVPGGRIKDATSERLLRTAGQASSIAQLEEIPVTTPRGAVVKLRNLAAVSDGHAEIRTVSRLDGQDGVVARVRKQSGTNTVRVADAVKSEIGRLRAEYPDLRFGIASDQSILTHDSVQDVQTSLLLGGILAAAVVMLFFRNLRNTLVTVAGLPVVVFGTFIVLYSMGISLNMVTLMALSISVGMLIDDAIVVRENILRHMEKGEEPKVAAGRGSAEIALAVVAVTSTIVAVFLPMVFTGGMAGKLLREFGITVVVAVLISLVEAFTLAPMLSAHFFRRGRGGREDGNTSEKGDSENGTTESERGRARRSPDPRVLYRGLLAWSLRHRAVVVGIGLLAFAMSLAVLPFIPQSFQAIVDQGEFGVAIELEPGARLEDTERVARIAEEVLRADQEVVQLFTSVGSTEGAANTANIAVKLRSRGRTDAVVNRVRGPLDQALPEVKLTFDKEVGDPSAMGGAALAAVRGRPIQFSIEGPDVDQLSRVSTELVARLQQVPGVVDVDSSLRAGQPQDMIVLDRAKATDLGVTVAEAGSTLRAMVNGEKAGTYRAADKDVDIVVRLEEADRNRPERILQIPVLTARGDQLRLSSVATLLSSVEQNQIDRANRQRQVVVGASFMGRDPGPAMEKAMSLAASTVLPEEVTIRPTGEAQYMEESSASLMLALVLSVVFVYMILASQLRSFVHPFTIMLALPFSFVGALLALLLTGFSLDMLAMVGMILLMGLVSKNSILLVDFTNQLRRRGLATRDAILEAGQVRLRPILMTTLSMIFGMIPVAVGFGAGAELRQPMGVSVVGGLMTSTLLTLVVVPVAYSLIDDAGRWLTRHSPRTLPKTAPSGLVEEQ